MAETKKFLTLEGLGTFKTLQDADHATKIATSKTEAVDASKVTVETATTTEGYAKSYTIKQNNVSVAVIDIPKDMVVSSGKVVVNPEGQAEGTYLELTLANATNDKIYINVGTLVDIYVAESDATQVQITIDPSTREISANIVAGSITATELATKSVTRTKVADGAIDLSKVDSAIADSLGRADSAIQNIEAGTTNGTITVDGESIAIKGLDTAAYAKTTDFDAAGTAETKVNALATGAVATNTTDIATLRTKIDNLEASAIEAISIEDINSLFDTTE